MSIESVIIMYWSVFWLTNGLDKFLNNTNLILFEWFGKDRADQFSGYFTALNIPTELVDQVLLTIGVWELCIAGAFLAAYIYLEMGRLTKTFVMVRYGFFMTIVIFIIFSGFDVLVGDRFELFEHNAYIAMAILAWFVLIYRRDKGVTNTHME